MSDRSLQDVISLFGRRSRTRGLADYQIFAQGPVIDLRLERHNRLIKREYDRVLDQVLALSTMQGSRLTAEALIILVNASDIHIRSIRAEFRSFVSLLQNDEDRNSMEFERDMEVSELTRMKDIGEADLLAHRENTHSPERVANKVINVLQKMETARKAFSRTIRALASSRL
ncbi:uncharacterized protein LOC127867181 isoform X2 [Dreissena polymorpha]|uniref:uncharacterized protein LOC127867181 isoform X2 n=1 Tax=Dreissena polymorpha TaxID=45954 RepID=UPI002264A256|nr:uncharacterized protein LOC127867181 isoform X2 [Dreissena polymorpha]